MNWKRLFVFLLVLLFSTELSAQRDSGTRKTDSSHRRRSDSTATKRDTTRRSDTSKPVIRPKPKPPVTAPVIRADSTRKDSATAVVDTVRRDTIPVAAKPPVVHTDTSSYYAYFHHPNIAFGKPPVYMVMKERQPQSKDQVFYLLVGLLFFMAAVRLLFPKYFQNTFRLFFQTTFRQKQTRDQLLQQGLGSLLLNLLFFFSGAIYIALALQHYKLTIFPFWQLLLYSCLALFVLYLGKFLFLTFAGWVFNVKEGAQTYIFIVFLINKIIGVMLIPFILVIAFSQASLVDAAVTASLILLALLFFYRYFVSLKSFRRDLHINPFHFFLYLCGVEIVPLLIIGKVVFNYLDGTL
jgi:hypothetical protein